MNFDWTAVGLLSLDTQGKIRFPKTGLRPGIYRFDIELEGVRQIYVGETDQLERRLQHYRTPGPSQVTNIRVNKLVVNVLSAGGTVHLSTIAESAGLHVDGSPVELSFKGKAERVLFEHAAIVMLALCSSSLLNARI